MKLICLCNGKGERFKPLSEKFPKSLVPINGTPNLINTIKLLYSTGKIDEVVIAGKSSYFNHEIYQEVRKYLYSNNIKLFEVNCDTIPENYNNASTMLKIFDEIQSPDSTSNYIVVEGDILINERFLDFFNSCTFDDVSKVFCTYRSHEWVVGQVNDKSQIFKDSEGLALSGVSYVSCPDSHSLYRCMLGDPLILSYLNQDNPQDSMSVLKNLFWDELFINSCNNPVEVIDCEDTLKEYDYVVDLVYNEIMKPFDIARLLSDDGVVVRCNSMTNETFKITYKDTPYILKIPKKGSDTFINRSYEDKVISLLSRCGCFITPETLIYPKGVKLVKYVEGSRVSEVEDIGAGVNLINRLHNCAENFNPDYFKDLLVNLVSEISSYESLYTPDILDELGISTEEYLKTRRSYVKFIKEFQHNDLTLCHRDFDLRNILIEEKSGYSRNDYLVDFEYSGVLNLYWDYGCYLSELILVDKNHESEITRQYLKHFKDDPSVVDMLVAWSGVADFVWSCWSLAQISLGEHYLEYFWKRWKRCQRVLKDMT